VQFPAVAGLEQNKKNEQAEKTRQVTHTEYGGGIPPPGPPFSFF
jgi:hypothetical protein